MRKNLENLLKRNLKRKITITMAMITSFMITGEIGFADGALTKPGKYEKTHYVFTENPDMKNGDAPAGRYIFSSKDETGIQFYPTSSWKKGFSVSDPNNITVLKFNGDASFTSNGSGLNSMLSATNSHLRVTTNSTASEKKLSLKNPKDIKNGIVASNNGGVYIDLFDNVNIIGANENTSFENGIKAENKGKISITAGKEINLKNVKTGVLATGDQSNIFLNSKNINIVASNKKTGKTDGSYGLRAINEGKIILGAQENINITGDLSDNKYFYKRAGILAEQGGKIELESNKNINITAYRGIDNKEGGDVKTKSKNGNINIKANENGVYLSKLENKTKFNSNTDLIAEQGDIDITAKKYGVYGTDTFKKDKSNINMTAKNIRVNAEGGDGIYSGGTAQVNLKAENDISIEGSVNAIHSADGDKVNFPNIVISTNKLTLNTLRENSNSGILAEDKTQIKLDTNEELNISSFKNGIKAENESNITATSKDKLNIRSIESGIETSNKATFAGIAKNIKIVSDGRDQSTIKADTNSRVLLEGEKISLLGNINVDNNAELKVKKLNNEEGNVEIALNANEIKNYRENKFYPSNYDWAEINAENGGTIDLDLKGKDKNNGSILIGQLRNNIGTSNAGKINLFMDKDSIFVPRKSNSISTLNLNGGTIDLAKDKGSSIHIETLKGEGTFNVFADTKEHSNGNMIYIQNFASENNKATSENKLNVQDIDLKSLHKGEKVRFATLGKNAKNKVFFKGGVIQEKGIQDVGVKVLRESFDANDEENSKYKDKVFNDKYGFNNYEEGENWYITRENEIIDATPILPAPPVEKPEPPVVEPKPPVEKPEPPVVEPKPPVEKPEPPVVKPNRDNDITKVVTEIAKANYDSAVYLDNLNKRLGDMGFANGNDGIWIRLRGDKVGEDKEYKLNNYMTQIGYDKVYYITDGEEHIGVAFDYTKGSMDYKNINGSSKIDRYMASIYDTRVYNNGIYTDIVGKVGSMASEFDIITSKQKYQVDGKYKNLILGASGEIGKKFTLDNNIYIEPQAQLQYTYVNETDYTTNQGTKVKLDDINSLIGRIGFRIGHDFYNENRKDNTIYLKTDINHEFLGNQNVKAYDLTGSIDRKYENKNTWFDLGIGASKDFTENLNVYTDIEKQFGEYKDNNSWQVNLGFKYKFDTK